VVSTLIGNGVILDVKNMKFVICSVLIVLCLILILRFRFSLLSPEISLLETTIIKTEATASAASPESKTPQKIAPIFFFLDSRAGKLVGLYGDFIRSALYSPHTPTQTIAKLTISIASQNGRDDGDVSHDVSQKDIQSVMRANRISAWYMTGTIIALIIRLFLKRKQ
jgi:hypothetical protein